MNSTIFPAGGKMLKISISSESDYSFQHACHTGQQSAENCRRFAPKYAHICREKIMVHQNGDFHHSLNHDFSNFLHRKLHHIWAAPAVYHRSAAKAAGKG